MNEFDNIPSQPSVHRSWTPQEMEEFCAMIRGDIQCMMMTLFENWQIVQAAKKEVAMLEDQWALPAYEKK